MIAASYLLVTAFALFGIGMAGAFASRNLVGIMLSLEVAFVAAIVALAYVLSTMPQPNGMGAMLLLGIWSVAAIEVMLIASFYVYMRSRGIDLDIRKLSRRKY